MTTYSQSLVWTNRPGSTVKVTVTRSTLAEAKRDVVAYVRKYGWTPPRWWQWWRRNDTKRKELT